MLKFIKTKQITLFLASLLTSVGLLSFTVAYSHTGVVTTPANACQPANLAQALARGMSWNQFRVFNPSDTQNFFVTCGVVRDTSAAFNSGYVVAHFDTGHDIADLVSCIWRSNNFDVDNSNIATTVLALTGDITRTGTELPTTNFNNDFDLDGSFPTSTVDRAWTVTCNLPAKSGLNFIGTF